MIALLWEDVKRIDKLEEDANGRGSDWEAEIINRKCSKAAKKVAGGDPSKSWRETS